MCHSVCSLRAKPTFIIVITIGGRIVGDLNNIFGNINKLVDQPLAVHLGQNAALVVVPGWGRGNVSKTNVTLGVSLISIKYVPEKRKKQPSGAARKEVNLFALSLRSAGHRVLACCSHLLFLPLPKEKRCTKQDYDPVSE